MKKTISERIVALQRRKKLAPQRRRERREKHEKKVLLWWGDHSLLTTHHSPGVKVEKNIISLILCLCVYLLLPCFSHAAEDAAVALYNRAGRAYEAERYEEAVAFYEEIPKMGIRDGRVYYNLGNAYFKAGRLGKAILSYERARRLLPRDEDIEANLRFVRLLKVDKEPPEERNMVVRFALNLYHAFSLNGLTKAVSGVYILIMFSVIGWILYGRRFRSVCVAFLIVLGAALVPVGGALAFKIRAEAFVKEAIVMADEVDARSGPGAEHTKIFAVHEGTKVTIERRDGDWVLVRLSSGIGGWVERKGMEEI